MKIRLKPKHYRLINHFARFIDTNYHKGYEVTAQDRENFIIFQSYGMSALSEEEYNRIYPLIYAQKMKEVTIKMLVEEMADFWSKGWGWYIPMAATLDFEFKDRHRTKDTIFLTALIKITKSIRKDGFVPYLISFPDIPFENKKRYLQQYEGL